MQKVFFTADTHFYHKNIIKYCDRPWQDGQTMTEDMIEQWNEVVGPNDTVWHLGDFVFTRDFQSVEYIMSKLHGRIHFVWGNHDHILSDNYRRTCELFEFIAEDSYYYVRINGQKITMCHYPMQSWKNSHHGTWHLFGHVHGNQRYVLPNLRMMDVGVDTQVDYRPYSFEEVKAHMDSIDVSDFRH